MKMRLWWMPRLQAKEERRVLKREKISVHILTRRKIVKN